MNRLRFLILRASAVIVLLSAATTPVLSAHASVPAATTTMKLVPVADTFASASYPGTNYGKAMSVRINASPITRGFLRFTVPALNGQTISHATLRLYAKAGNAVGLTVKRVSNTTWGEATLTYNNMPALSTKLASTGAIAAPGWVSLDVTPYVKAAGTFSFGLVTSSSNAFGIASRETEASGPKLILTLGAAAQPTFPIRAAFYYPWFASGWTQLSHFPYTNYHPQLGYYSSSDLATVKTHIQMMQYGNIQAGIASWWGQGSYTDGNIPNLLSAASGTSFRWALYYELESTGDPSVSQLQSDLTYIRDHYASNPAFLRVNGKFVIFVYTDGNDGCAMVSRWNQANTVGAYIVPKVFVGYTSCASQPDNWHQYGPANAADRQGNYSYSISPGFWKYGENVRLARDITRWKQNVKDMVASGTQWQLITTFSEWGEGTPVEPATEWASASGYGQYLDALHYNGNVP